MHKPLAKKKNQPFQASSYKHLSLVIIYLYLSSEYHGINYMDKGLYIWSLWNPEYRLILIQEWLCGSCYKSGITYILVLENFNVDKGNSSSLDSMQQFPQINIC